MGYTKLFLKFIVLLKLKFKCASCIFSATVLTASFPQKLTQWWSSGQMTN